MSLHYWLGTAGYSLKPTGNWAGAVRVARWLRECRRAREAGLPLPEKPVTVATNLTHHHAQTPPKAHQTTPAK